ncbi:MAG: DNA polymerase III subunit beta [Patescibacteria group bacterium]
MKIICTRENFKKAIFNSERVVSKQTTLPILNNILFETEKGGLKLSATNLEMGVEVRIGAKIEKEGKISIPARLLSNFINTLPAKSAEENIFLETNDQGLKIKSGATRATIKGLPATEFPLIPRKTAEFLLKLPGTTLKNTILQVINCAAINETRQELTGVNLFLTEEELFFAATDSFRLAEKRLKISNENTAPEDYKKFIEKKNNIIIPANTLIELSRIISNNEEGAVNIAIEDSQIFFEVNGTNIISRLINGKYPEYKNIIPKEFKTRGVIEKEMFQGAVKMASFFSAGKANELTLKIDPQKKNNTIEARSTEVGENTSELELEVTGQLQEVIFNARYLLDGINTISTSKVAILINSSTAPVALKEINEQTGEILDDYVYIVMPIKN